MHNEDKKAEHQRVLVKGYMRPDGTSYYVVIPKKIRELFNLNGGEYFLMKAKPEKGAILLKQDCALFRFCLHQKVLATVQIEQFPDLFRDNDVIRGAVRPHVPCLLYTSDAA